MDELKGLDPKGFSIAEMSARLGKSPMWCRQKIKELIHGGRARYVGKKADKMIDGRRCHVPAYTLIGDKDVKK